MALAFHQKHFHLGAHRRVWVIVFAVLAFLRHESAGAAPKNGIGLGAGLSWHSFLLPATPADVDFTSAGLGITLDAQFVWNDSWSINPALLFSVEQSLDGPVERDVFAYGTILQARYWVGNAYLGGHFGIFKEAIRSRAQTLSTGDGGVGLAAGYEPGNGLIFNLQLDWERLLTGETILAARFIFGYRWY